MMRMLCAMPTQADERASSSLGRAYVLRSVLQLDLNFPDPDSVQILINRSARNDQAKDRSLNFLAFDAFRSIAR
jgi:hypothetical protein